VPRGGEAKAHSSSDVSGLSTHGGATSPHSSSDVNGLSTHGGDRFCELVEPARSGRHQPRPVSRARPARPGSPTSAPRPGPPAGAGGQQVGAQRRVTRPETRRRRPCSRARQRGRCSRRRLGGAPRSAPRGLVPGQNPEQVGDDRCRCTRRSEQCAHPVPAPATNGSQGRGRLPRRIPHEHPASAVDIVPAPAQGRRLRSHLRADLLRPVEVRLARAAFLGRLTPPALEPALMVFVQKDPTAGG
jgi:hypothetical protein